MALEFGGLCWPVSKKKKNYTGSQTPRIIKVWRCIGLKSRETAQLSLKGKN